MGTEIYSVPACRWAFVVTLLSLALLRPQEAAQSIHAPTGMAQRVQQQIPLEAPWHAIHGHAEQRRGREQSSLVEVVR